MGSWKLLGWLAGIGMGEVRGAQAKNQGAQAFFMKILYTKKKKILDPGGARAPFALCLGPSLLKTTVTQGTRSSIDLKGHNHCIKFIFLNSQKEVMIGTCHTLPIFYLFKEANS